VSEINNKDILWISQGVRGGKGMRTERERGSKGGVCVENHSTSLISLERKPVFRPSHTCICYAIHILPNSS
jgi:hypothetical protein